MTLVIHLHVIGRSSDLAASDFVSKLHASQACVHAHTYKQTHICLTRHKSRSFVAVVAKVNGGKKTRLTSFLACNRGVDVSKRTVTTYNREFGHILTSYAYFLTLLLATSLPKFRCATIECNFQTFSLRFSC